VTDGRMDMETKIKEIIVVEGRDDTAALKRAVNADTIETHGFGIKKETWELLETAYASRGIIIFTDPDHAGEEIRKRLKNRFPGASDAYLYEQDVEDAPPYMLAEALQKARCTMYSGEDSFCMEDLRAGGLSGCRDAASKRRRTGEVLGIGYGSSRGFLKKLNQYRIRKEDFYEALQDKNHP